MTQEIRDSTEPDDLVVARAQIMEYQEEIAQLRRSLEERTQDINKLIQWTQSLQQDILAVYSSITWQTGQFITQMIEL